MIKDITGRRFGKLIALRPTVRRSGDRVVWECQCDCGNIVTALGERLKNGSKASCGCHLRSKSFVDLTGQKVGRLTVLGLSDKRIGAQKAIAFDCRCDCGKLVKVRMSELKKAGTRSCGCLRAEINARELMKARKIAHIEDTSIHALGGKIRANNTSGTTGVYHDKIRKKWRVTIGFKKKTYHLRKVRGERGCDKSP